MSALRMAISELRRITAGRLPRMAVIALLSVPMLYGGLYLYANHDPYGRLSQVPAALVVADRGTTTAQGTRLDAGAQVSRELLSGKRFDWHRTSEQDAAAGVRDGRYDFALTLPADFSQALASSGRYTPRQGVLQVTTNDANSYLSTTIAGQVVDAVRDALASQVGEQAAGQFLSGLTTIRGQLQQAATGAGQLAGGARQAADGAALLASGAGRLAAGEDQLVTGQEQLASGAAQAASGAAALASGAGRLDAGLRTLRGSTAALPAQTRALASGAGQVASGNERIAAVGDRVAAASADLTGRLGTFRADLAAQLRAAGLAPVEVDRALALADRLRAPVLRANGQIQGTTGQLDRLAAGARQVASGASRLAAAAPALSGGIARAASGADQLASGADRLASGTAQLSTGADRLVTAQRQAASGAHDLAAGAARLRTGTAQLATGAQKLASGLQDGVRQIPDLTAGTRAATARTIGDPVLVRNVSQVKAGSYGAGLAPFFLALATWIGAYVLFLLVRPLSDRATAADQTPLRVAAGGWLAPALLGAAQVVGLLLVVALGLRILPAHPLSAGLFMMLASVTFVAIVQALNAWLGTAGQFLALVLMILQLVSAGGTFPWQTIPAPLYALHHVLPMSYVVDGLRHLLYGGDTSVVWTDAGVLLLWLAAAVLLSGLAARRRRVWTVSRIRPELVL